MKVISRCVAVEIDDYLVGTDVLGDAAGLFLADVGLTDGVQQSGLAVVDVTHDGDHRRTALQVGLVALVLAVGEVEGLQQFAVLVLGADDLHDVVHLAAEQFERLVTHRLGGRDHLAEIEQCLHQRRRVRVDLLGEVGQRRAAGEPDGLAVAVRQPHAADDRRLHVLVLGAFCPLRLASASRRAAGTTERACGTAALTGTASAAATGTTAIAASRGCTATAAARDRRCGSYRRRRRRDHRDDRRAQPPGPRPPGAGRGRHRDVLDGRGAPPPGRGGILPGEAPGRGPPPGRGAPGRGACGRGIGRSTGWAEENGLFPTRGVRGAGLGPGVGAAGARDRGSGSWARAGAGADATAAGAAGSAGAGGGSGGAAGAAGRAFSGAGAFAAAFFAGAPLPSALTFSAAGFAPPKDSRSRRATGASTVEDADLTNSP